MRPLLLAVCLVACSRGAEPTRVTVIGSNVGHVYLNGVECASAVVNDAGTEVTFTTPEWDAGRLDVTIGAGRSDAGTYWYIPAPFDTGTDDVCTTGVCARLPGLNVCCPGSSRNVVYR